MQSDSHDSHDWESTDSEIESQPEASQNCNVETSYGSPSWELTDLEIESQLEALQNYNVETSQVPSESIVLIPSKSFQVSRDENEP
jgi:hypothetical protein